MEGLRVVSVTGGELIKPVVAETDVQFSRILLTVDERIVSALISTDGEHPIDIKFLIANLPAIKQRHTC